MADGMRFAGRVFDGSGSAINGATVNLYDVGTTTPVRATTTTNSTGDWEIDHATRGLFDIEIVNGTTTRRIVQDTEVQFKSAWLWNADANEFAFGVTRTEDDATVEVAYFEGDRATMADGDEAYIAYRLSNDAGTQLEFARIFWRASDVNAGTGEDGILGFSVVTAGTLAKELELTGAALYPNTNDGLALGTTSLGFADLHLASGGVINWVNGEITITETSANLLTIAGADVNISGNRLFVNTTANANMTIGVTIDQETNDNEALALGSSTDVAHGMTGLALTNVYMSVRKEVATAGGAQFRALMATGQSWGAVRFLGAVTDAVDTTKTTGGYGVFRFDARLRLGTSAVGVGADGNLFTIDSNGTTRFIFDVEGSAHADVEWTTFDTHDDLALIEDLEAELLARGETSMGRYSRHAMERAGIIGKNSWHFEDGKPRAMVNFSRLAMLHHGAFIQAARRFAALEAQVGEIRRMLPAS